MWPSTTSGAATNTKREFVTNDVDVYGLAFDGTAQEFAQATIAMPSDWDGGTVTAIFYWYITSTSTNSAVWQCMGRSYGDAETFDQAWGTPQEVADAGSGTTEQMLKSAATSAITLEGTPAAGELVQFRIARDPADGSDTLTAIDAILVGVMITYTRT